MVQSSSVGSDGSRLMAAALVYMRAALELLDQAEAPADIGAHLDLAVVRLEESIMPSSQSFRANP